MFVDFRHFWRFGLKLLFFGNSAIFRTLRLRLISAKPYYQNAHIDRGIIFGFRPNLANDCKLLVRSGFLEVSLISAFSVGVIDLSGTLCGRPPPTPPPGPHGGGGGGIYTYIIIIIPIRLLLILALLVAIALLTTISCPVCF